MLKRKYALGLALLLATSALASCGPNTEDDNGRPTITCWINEGNNYAGKSKDSVISKIEEICGINLKIKGAQHNDNYYKTLEPMINTGSPADLVFIVPSGCDAYTSWVQQDVFYDYDELIAEKPGEYPYLERLLHCDQFKNIQYADEYGNGMHTISPFITSKNGWTIYYRGDWLINVGYYTEDAQGIKTPKVPVTMDEFQDVMKKFTENDPDGNGENDTCGLCPAAKATWFSPLFHAFGCTTDYDLDSNNQPIHQYIQPEFKNFLTWAQTMTQKGYIDKNYVTNTNSEDREVFYKGKSGILITNGETHVQWVVKGVENMYGQGCCVVGPAPVGTATCGKEGCGGFSDWGGWWGGFSLMKECKDPHAAMRFLNYINSPEGLKLFHYGIEGVHYDVVDGKFVPNLENRAVEKGQPFKAIENEEGDNVPAGMHEIGSHFQAYYEWVDKNHFKFTPDISSIPYQYRDYFDKTVELNTLVTSKLTNVTGYPSNYAGYMKDMEDDLNTYAISCIATKKNLTSDYEAVMNKISNNWTKIKRIILEVAQNCEII